MGESSSVSSEEENPVTNDRKYYSNLISSSINEDQTGVVNHWYDEYDFMYLKQLCLNFSQLGLIIYMYISVI